MSLFQKVIVKKYLKNLSSDLMEENYKKYTKYFNDSDRIERIKALKEEQYQEGFLRELFVDCLGYTINPNENYNLTTEYKNLTDAEKTDGAILKDGNPIAVIELKSTKIKDLKSIEKQAFNYKAHQQNCKYVITSNFEKIRLYIDDATECEEFNVFELSESEFKYLYLCLNKDSIFENIPAIMKEKSNQHEEQISKKLYNDYSVFRNNIYENLIKNNPHFDKLLLFKKSQKLLDRFLFIFFAEDKGLIPANFISKIIEDYNKLQEMDHYAPLYNEFIRFFGYINEGNEKYAIEAYNGGLFQFDEILDKAKIDDEILINDALKLSNYDFDSEIDVNILGHIFEHSLTDIEKLNAEISGEDLNKKQTRRKKEGVFYTPNYITKYIVENTVGTLCSEKKNELKLNNLEIDETYFKKTKNSLSKKGELLFEKLEDYKKWLLSLKIIDPACGSGAFLNQALNFLIDEHNFIVDNETDLRKGQYYAFDIDTAVLENNLYGVDINEESIEIAKLSLWLKTAKKGRKLTDLSKRIKCGNSLIDDPEIAGEKAFDWHKEFPEVFYTKEKRSWHITTATHNSRYSQRMLDNHVKLGDPVWLTTNDEINITETIAEIIEEDNLNIPAYNICGDHLHMILVCEEDEMTKIVGKIKAVSARKCNMTTRGKSTPEVSATRGHVPLATIPLAENKHVLSTEESPAEPSATRGRVPLAEEQGADRTLSPAELPATRGYIPLAESKHVTLAEKTRYNPLWTQKFGRKEIVTDQQLNNTLNYIRNNRKKHELPENKKLNTIIEKMTCTIEHAYRFEYKGGFDVVIGNPPYVVIKGGRWVGGFQYDKKSITYLKNKFVVSSQQINTYILFLELGLKLTRDGGLISQITPNTFLTNEYSQKLRTLLIKYSSIKEFFKSESAFEDASVETVITTYRNTKISKQIIDVKLLNFNEGYNLNLSEIINFTEDSKYLININKKSIPLLKKLSSIDKVSKYAKVWRGLTTGDDKKYLSFKEETNLHKPIISGSEIERYYLKENTKFVYYVSELLDRPRDERIFLLNEKLISKFVGKKLTFCYDNHQHYVVNTACSIELIDKNVNLYFLLTILNSKLINFYFQQIFSDNRDTFPIMKSGNIESLPMKYISSNNQQPFIQKADSMLSLNKQKQEKINKFLHRLETNFEIDKLSNKMKAFYNYDFKTIIAELKKKKIKLTLSQQDEWEEYFNNYKEKINELQKQIDKTDKEIDQMVYKLYGLTKEEIEIVEKG